MKSPTAANDLPTPIWIALVVLGFILFWPLGLITMVYLIWSRKMMCCMGRWVPWKNNDVKRWNIPRSESNSTGNVAFDEYRETTLRRLEEERQEFTQFLDRLRRAKDQDEFDRFMSEQASRQSPK